MAGNNSKETRTSATLRRVRQLWRRPAGKIGAAVIAILVAVVFGAASVYDGYSRQVDRELRTGPFADTSNIFAAPRTVEPEEALNSSELLGYLRRSGYGQSQNNPVGWYRTVSHAVEIRPGPECYGANEPVRVEFAKEDVSRIVSLRNGRRLESYTLAPELLTNIGQNRDKRRLVRYSEIPKVLIDAVLSAEDKRFFEHHGFDSLRMLKAAWVDFKQGRKQQGASTITMQLARSLWLEPAKNWRRKLAEMMITAHLESKLSKQQIFEDYANEVYLGRRGTYAIHGFGEAAREYFGKDLRYLTLPEAATLAGIIQRPGYLDPVRHPDRAIERRRIVLTLMRQNRFITNAQFREANRAPIHTVPAAVPSGEAPYFMDLLANEIQNQFQDRDIQARNVYTTLDPDLQRQAIEAVNAGMQKVDKLVAKSAPLEPPQVALVALDPHTGQVRALVGGRSYADSQLNRVLAWRQPGSAFKPFVYAAALKTGITGGPQLFTPATVLDDEPTTFLFNNQPYEPHNFEHEVFGEVSLRRALAQSVNVISVKVAQAVGYQTVAELAHAAGLHTVEATPSAALGAYDVTPLQLAGAYTVFSNAGVYVDPSLIATVRDARGRVIFSHKLQTRRVLDPRVAYLMVSMMQDVLRSGTAASAQLGVPAAGKTGTSRDGWFAGFTSELLTIVWVGYDDGHDLKLEGAKSALPIWADFMKRALEYPRYNDTQRFAAPPGITSAVIDPESGDLADPGCPDTRTEVFISGTQPTEYCPLHQGLPPLVASTPPPPATPATVIPPATPAAVH